MQERRHIFCIFISRHSVQYITQPAASINSCKFLTEEITEAQKFQFFYFAPKFPQNEWFSASYFAFLDKNFLTRKFSYDFPTAQHFVGEVMGKRQLLPRPLCHDAHSLYRFYSVVKVGLKR